MGDLIKIVIIGGICIYLIYRVYQSATSNAQNQNVAPQRPQRQVADVPRYINRADIKPAPTHTIQTDIKRNLESIIRSYEEYACSDARQYAQFVRPDLRPEIAEQIYSRYRNIPQHLQILEARANISASLGNYSLFSIKNISKDIDRCKSACCTTFAISAADKIMQQYPDYRVEIVTTSAHCFVLVNRKVVPGEDPNLTSTPSSWGPQAVICDPWLASLQWQSVYQLGDTTYPFIHELSRFQKKFDSLSSKASPTVDAAPEASPLRVRPR